MTARAGPEPTLTRRTPRDASSDLDGAPGPASTLSGLVLSVVTPLNDGPFGLHNLGEDLLHEIFAGTGHWLHLDGPEEFNEILDEFVARA